jgi:hypothetical protein
MESAAPTLFTLALKGRRNHSEHSQLSQNREHNADGDDLSRED